MKPGSAPLLWTALWLIVMAAAVTLRPFLPVDETRYLAVAWEMWRDGNFLVPHLNGEPYSHKPPLLFWMIHLGWAIFGVNDFTPRLAAPVFGLGSLFLTARLGRALWPDLPALATTAPFILFGAVFWTLFTTLTMFDMMLALFTLLGLLGIVKAQRGGLVSGFALLGLGIGLGVLAKGPAILLHTLPVALLAPFWGAAPAKGGWKRWYLGVLGALLLGVAIGLAWAVPAAIEGGEAYRDAIFWGQSAGRMVNSFAHKRSWWWFLAVLPPLLLPWTVWPPLWRAARGLPDLFKEPGVRFCLSWFLPAFIAFSLISGKQLHYLLPIFPALALLIARLLETKQARDGSWIDRAAPGGLFALIGGAMLVLPLLAETLSLPYWAETITPLGAGLILAAGLFIAFLPFKTRAADVIALAVLSTVFVVGLHLSLKPMLSERFDLREISQKLGAWERQGFKLAHSNKYHGQFNFMGRLTTTFDIVGQQEAKDWAIANPKGKVVSYHKELPKGLTPDYVQRFRGKYIAVWDSSLVREHPYVAFRQSGPSSK